MALTPQKMNLDYEAQLFEGKSSEKMNQALEYLAFYLGPGPFTSEVNYSEEFLSSIEKLSGIKPLVKKSKEFVNIWGPLQDEVREREFNSKISSAELTKVIAPQEVVSIICSKQDLPGNQPYPLVLKLPHSMSGKGVRKILGKEDLVNIPFPYVLEPLRKRFLDFSHFIYPDGKSITYENMVDERFQYRGTIFHRIHEPSFSSIPRVKKITMGEQEKYLRELRLYREAFENKIKGVPKNLGYSIDSFIYEDNGELRIRTCSEFNFRRTMGWLTYELARRLVPDSEWVALRIFFLKKNPERLRAYLNTTDKMLFLSPSESSVQVILIKASDSEEGKNLLAHANGFDVHKLPDTEF